MYRAGPVNVKVGHIGQMGRPVYGPSGFTRAGPLKDHYDLAGQAGECHVGHSTQMDQPFYGLLGFWRTGPLKVHDTSAGQAAESYDRPNWAH